MDKKTFVVKRTPDFAKAPGSEKNTGPAKAPASAKVPGPAKRADPAKAPASVKTPVSPKVPTPARGGEAPGKAGLTAPKEVAIREDYIKLDSFLKFAGAALSGGEATELVQGGKVSVNGEVCAMRGKKLRAGDEVSYAGKRYRVAAETDGP